MIVDSFDLIWIFTKASGEKQLIKSESILFVSRFRAHTSLLHAYETHSHSPLTSLLVPLSVYSVCWLPSSRKFREHLSFDLPWLSDNVAVFQYRLCPWCLYPRALPQRADNADLLCPGCVFAPWEKMRKNGSSFSYVLRWEEGDYFSRCLLWLWECVVSLWEKLIPCLGWAGLLCPTQLSHASGMVIRDR